MSERHPNVKCFTTWCEYWEKVFEGKRGEKVGGCGAWDLAIATISGEDAATCMTYKIHHDLSKRSELKGCPHCGSPTKHKKGCPDQQIINAYKELRAIHSKVIKCQE